MVEKTIIDNHGNLRWQAGTQKCGICGSKKEVIQFERDSKRKGLPILEIAFICKPCAEKEGLIKDSIPYVKDTMCDSCHKITEVGDYNGKQYCNNCVNAEEHGEKANN